MALPNIVAELGVALAVEGLEDFARRMKAAQNVISEFGKSSEEASQDVGPLSKALDVLGESLRRIGEFVIAGLIVKGLEAIGRSLSNLVKQVIDSGIQFQKLKIRLEGLIAKDIFNAGLVDSFTDALDRAGPPAEQLFFWIQKLAFTTPFDIEDVANVLSLAKAFGLTTPEAQTLTMAVADFTAAMGLGDEVMERIIINFGQMIQQGKITGTELRDLGRGAFLPINELLDRTAQKLGITTDELGDLRKDGLAPVEPFLQSFIDLVGEQMSGAAERAAITIEGVTGNIADLVLGLLGMNVVRPVLDGIAQRLDQILDLFTQDDKIDEVIENGRRINDAFLDTLDPAPGTDLINITATIGKTLAQFFDNILGIDLPKWEEFRTRFMLALIDVKDAIQDLAEGDFRGALEELGVPESVLKSLDRVAEFVQKIVENFLLADTDLAKGLGAFGVPQPIIDFFVKIQEALENFRDFWDSNGERIMEAFESIATSVGNILAALGITIGTSALDTVGDIILGFSEFLVENDEAIVTAIEDFATALDEKLIPALGAAGIWIKETFLPALGEFGDWISEHKEEILTFLKGLGALLLLIVVPITLAAIAVGTLVTAVLIAVLGIGVALGVLGLLFVNTLGKIVENIQAWIEDVKFKWVQLRVAIWEKTNEFNAMVLRAFIALKDLLVGSRGGKVGVINEIKDALAEKVESWSASESPIIKAFGTFTEAILAMFTQMGIDIKTIIDGIISAILKAIELFGQLGGGNSDTAFPNLGGAGASALVPATVGVPGLTTNRTNNSTVNNSLTVNTSASSEPIIADFQMLRAMAG